MSRSRPWLDPVPMPTSDAPSTTDAKKLTDANLVIVNGLGLEGWIPRLVKASGNQGRNRDRHDGCELLRKMQDEHHGGRMTTDPHAWQSIANVKIYVCEHSRRADQGGSRRKGSVYCQRSDLHGQAR